MGLLGKPARVAVAVAVVALAAVLPVGSRAEAAPAQAACSLTPTGGTVTRTLGSRSYRLRVPAGINGPSARLIVSLHGWNGSASSQESSSGLSTYADQSKFIVAYPVGTYRTTFPLPLVGWNYFTQSNTDITYLRSVVSDISATWCVNPNWVHAEGISMGGLMSQRLGCEASDVFASVSGQATNDVTRAWFDVQASQPCSLPRPISVFLSCGATDTATDSGCAPARDLWAARLACPAHTTPAFPYGEARSYTPCNAGEELAWRKWTGLGHAYPATGAQRDHWFAQLYAFYTAHPKP